jgi:hypothetical protein
LYSVSDNQQQLLVKIKEERRKELLFRGIRWSDIRRYNVLDKDNIKIVRTLDGKVFELKPRINVLFFHFQKQQLILADMKIAKLKNQPSKF